MTYEEFVSSCRESDIPHDAPSVLHALFEDYRGDWDAAHTIAQGIATSEGSAVHAYLHRKEGDIGNAHYWYARADVAPFSGTLEEEWEALVRRFVAAG